MARNLATFTGFLTKSIRMRAPGQGARERWALGLAIPTLILMVSGLPCVTSIQAASRWSTVFLAGEGLIHGLALAAVLRLGAVLAKRFVGDGAARVGFAIGVGALALVVAVDATVYGAVGYHALGKNLAYLGAPGARETLGITRSDLGVAFICTGVAAAITFVTCASFPRPRRAAVVALVLVGMDGAYSFASEVARFEGARSIVGLAEAMPLAWAPRANRLLVAVLKHPPLATVHDFIFPSTTERTPEIRVFQSTSQAVRPPNRPDILILGIESARADEVSQLPHLKSLADRAVVATRHYSGGNCSFLGLFTLLTGLDPMYWSASETWRAPNGLGAFSAFGYRIRFKESIALNYGVLGRVVAEGQASLVPTPDRPPPERDEDTTRWAVEWLEQPHSEPEIAVAILDATHWPYSWDPSGELHVSLADTWGLRKHAAEIRERYRVAMRTADGFLARILEAADARPPERPLVLVVTGDHGEAFGEHGVFMHGNRLDEEQLRVPLVMLLPHHPHVEVQERTVHQDVLPTILAALGGTPVQGPGLGVDLLSASPRASNLQIGACAISTNEGLMAFEGSDRVLFQLDKRGAHFVAALRPDDDEIQDAQLPWIQNALATEAKAYEERLVSRKARP